jgi:peptide/nickel transport system permease protein
LLGVLVRSVVQLAVTLAGITTILFFLIRASGDPTQLLLGPDATREQIEALRAALGLDRPLLEQFAAEMLRIAQLDFGKSLRAARPAIELVLDRLWISLQLTFAALGFAVACAIPIGVAAAAAPRSWLARGLMALSFVGQALPIFWTGPILILLFAVTWRVLPTSDWTTPAHMILPTITLGSVLMAKLARIVRAQMLEVLEQDYIRTARAKGVPAFAVIVKHALRNTLIPVVTVIGAELGALVGAAVLTESIFAIPGLGATILNAALARDYPVLQAGVFVVAVVVVLINAAVDLAYVWLDPRTRRET